jgi:hypothetical protein
LKVVLIPVQLNLGAVKTITTTIEMMKMIKKTMIMKRPQLIATLTMIATTTATIVNHRMTSVTITQVVKVKAWIV